MRVLVVGGAGMLGHRLWLDFRHRFDAFVTLRQPLSRYQPLGLFSAERTIDQVDVESDSGILRALDEVRPQVIVNAVGVIKQLDAAHDAETCIRVNSLLPHRLARFANERRARLIHISTDCVFSGTRGNYSERDVPDATDLYGRSKLLGETRNETAITVRTSMIGRELATTAGLIEWFLGQRGKVIRGFKRAVFSGFTTQALAKVLGDLIEHHPDLTGLWHVSADPINKFELLTLVNRVYDAGVTIDADETFTCDRSLDSSAYREKTGFRPPSWAEMIAEMRATERR